MKKIKLLITSLTVFSLLFVTSCSSDDNGPIGPDPVPTGEFAQGIFILNEGNFGGGNSSVSFLSPEGELQHEIFASVNGSQLGDTGQNLYLNEDRAYIVMNGSGTVEVVDRYTFERIGTISEGLENPRYMVVADGKGYVSNWGDPLDTEDDYIAVIDLNSLSITQTISVPEGPEKMVATNGKIYVAQKGGWGYGNSVSVISIAENNVIAQIPVADIPESLFIDDNTLIVLSSGKEAWTGEETEGALSFIEMNSNLPIYIISFDVHPKNLVKDGDNLFFTSGSTVYATDVFLSPVSTLFSMDSNGIFDAYGFDVKDGKIYVGDAGDFVADGTVYIYNLQGDLLEEFVAGPLPNGFAFND